MLSQRIANWREVIDTANLAPERQMDAVSRWLIITRAAVFSMTLTSGLVGALLAIAALPAQVNWLHLGLALIGLVVAHAANNMINDYFDLESGVDTDEYVRALYAPHPILSGLVSRSGLRNAILAANAIDLAIMLYLAWAVGWPVIAFALAGAFISFFYVAPPVALKHRGLGEPGVFLVWGPLMIGGTFYVATGSLPGWIWIASLPYTILVTSVLFGKHIDKIEPDGVRGVRTLPVILGETWAKRLAVALMVAFYPIVIGLALTGFIGPWVLLVVLALPKLWQTLRVFAAPRPAEPPPDYPVWPLWFVSAAFVHTRRAGATLILGLLLNVLLPVQLPWVGG